ncbi:SET domain-containing protein/YDG_SRA domain-containing protein/Pre-SET domain-containing protein [Cephalotus follicularis]|uniref:SET domain-containing protein/YDG_SRA domain-containing protein/Pre-SET domain-containing protein n=1 Tax=Cephalotus follicularis TaxID=3775 RepID=A0A1Q3BVU3_CEPFO|nr:SET domain-containing protein/YDG_SRA domain-containing protein/Pre-SET domain-containing protein [Cephalotus follicularis]
MVHSIDEQRRESPRIKTIHAIKKPYYGDDKWRTVKDAGKDEENEERTRVSHSKQKSPRNMGKGVDKRNENLNSERKLCKVPGIQAGHRFYSREEMVAYFHGDRLKGLNNVGLPRGKLERNDYPLPLAMVMVISGEHEDADIPQEFVYTDKGGNNLLDNKDQVKNQILCRGNLALQNNSEQSIPVKVIRKFDCKRSSSGKVYRYDGLYKVNQFWLEKCNSGLTVLNYSLRRLPEQAELKDQIHNALLSKASSKLSRFVCKDISYGKEAICIPATNDYDDVAPAGFEYITSIQVAKNVEIPLDSPGCNCKGSCNDRRSCSCAQLNGSDFPYVLHKGGGRLIKPKDVVFECGPNCGCGPSCVNRTSQQGIKYHLEVYRTLNKGWAVRSRDSIPSGAPVTEYTGILMKTDELDNVSDNDYIFEIDCWQTMNEMDGRERRLGDVSLPTKELVKKNDNKSSESVPEFCIDAGSFGNVARFINHSCEPNLFVQCILSSHQDIRLARVVLFAADDIPAWEELTYDYNYALDSVIGLDGKVKSVPCHCGKADCRKRLY